MTTPPGDPPPRRELSAELARLLDPIAALRDRADLSAVRPGTQAPEWLRSWFALAMTDAGVLALTGPGGLHIVDEDLEKHRLEVDQVLFLLGGLAGHARRRQRRVAVGCPPGGRHVPLALAAASVLAQAVEHSVRPDLPTHPVLVVSPDLDLRRCYTDVCVGSGPDAVPLNDVYPGSRMLPDGKRVILKKTVELARPEGVCFFLPGLRLPSSLGFVPRHVIGDLRFATWSHRLREFVPWLARTGKCVLALYTIGDLQAREALMQAGFADCPLDHGVIRTCATTPSPPGESAGGLQLRLSHAASYLNRHHAVTGPKSADAVERGLAEVRTLLDSAPDDIPDVQRARWVAALLTRLPVPLSWYDPAAHDLGRHTLQHLIQRLGFRVAGARDVGPLMQTIRAKLMDLHSMLAEANPLAGACAEALPRLIKDTHSATTLVLVRDRVVARALRGWLDLELLAGAPEAERVHVRSHAEFVHFEESADLAVVFGSFPSRYRWIAGAALARQVHFVAYAIDWASIERQLRPFFDPAATREHLASLVSVLSRLGGQFSDMAPRIEGFPLQIDPPPLPRNVHGTVAHRSLTAKGLGDLGQLLRKAASLQTPPAPSGIDDLFDEEDPPDAAEPSSGNESGDIECVVLCVRTRWRGEGTLTLDAAAPVDCYVGDAADTVARIEGRDLKVGHIVIRVDEGGREGLLERITELAEKQPTMQNVGAFRRSWRSALDRLAVRYREGDTLAFPRMLADLRARGATIRTPIAIRFWMKDMVIGPETAGTIRAVGRLAGMAAIDRDASQFDAAFRKVRSLHQALGRRLAFAIRRSLAHETAEVRTPDIDPHLSLPLDELVESADLCEVTAVQETSIRLPSHVVGHFVPSP